MINGFKAGIRRRSDDVNNNTYAELAAIVHPQFTLYWLREEVQKASLVTTLKSHVDAMMKEENKKTGWQNFKSNAQPETEDFTTNFFSEFFN